MKHSTIAVFTWLLIGALFSNNKNVVNAAVVPTVTVPAATSAVEFIILHNNDMHARFEQTGKYSNTCPDEDKAADKCYGGFARVSSVLKRYRTEALNGGPSVLYLNAGDTYTGTPWFTLFKDKITADFLNILKPDAIVSNLNIV
jgi:2',3'-cyclic-nucleotide 2'-phosphodiesterase (5'-nucleotidase family)